MKLVIFILTIIWLTPCQAGNDKRYKSAIQQALDNQQPLCLGEKKWPTITYTKGYSWINAKMEALKDAGLITKSVATEKIEWRLTSYGLKQFKKSNDFCYGKFKVNKISEVISNSDGTLTIYFTYLIADLSEWAKNKAVRVAYTDLDNDLMGINHARYEIKFRKEGSGKLTVISQPSQLDLLY